LKSFRNPQSAIRSPQSAMFAFLRHQKPFRFLLVSMLLAGAAVGAGLIAAVAGQAGDFRLAAFSSKAALGLAIIIVLYVAPRLARSISSWQWRSDYALHVTNAGLIFSAAILMVTVLALSSGNNLLYLVLAALLATMIVSVIGARLNLKRLAASVRFPDHIFTNEAVTFEVILHSKKRLLPSFSLSVDLVEEHQVPSSTPGSPAKNVEQKAAVLGYFPIIPARAHARMRIERNFAKRGVYPIAGFVISTSFPFGFVEQRRLIEWPGEVAVYPQPRPLGDFGRLLPYAQGRIESRAKGSGSDLYAIRPYLSSDHHHHIDWKATAKTGRLMVREFTRDDDWRVTITFDSQTDEQAAAAEGFDETFERAITFTASLITHFIELDAEVRLVTPDGDSGFGSSPAHRFEMLRRLAQVSPQLFLLAPEETPDRSDEWESGFEILVTPNGGTSSRPAGAPQAHVIRFEELS
jgi:uncharacterized protein (DUF58 family)